MRVEPIYVIRYSNAITDASFESALQAQRIAACSVFVRCTEQKLREFKILDINALAHYKSPVGSFLLCHLLLLPLRMHAEEL